MKLLDRTMVNLASSRAPALLGHISLYELPTGNLYYVYYIEEKFYAAKEICKDTNKILNEKGSDNDYHYNVDIFFIWEKVSFINNNVSLENLFLLFILSILLNTIIILLD